MIKSNQVVLVVIVSSAVLTAGGILVADNYVAPSTSVGAMSTPNAIINVGQTVIGLTSDTQISLHAGVIPVYAFAVANAPNDCNANGVVDLEDYGIFEGCLMGPGGGLGLDCDCADLDGDLDTDLRDASQLMQSFGVDQ